MTSENLAPGPIRATERLMVRVGGAYLEVSVDAYEPPNTRATVFCLHDYLGGSQDFRQLAAFLAGHDYRVICPDIIGRGDSAFLSNPTNYSIRTYLVSLMAIMQRFADRRIIVIGKGWGALLALLLIGRASFGLEDLIVADLPLTWSTERIKEIWQAAPQSEFSTLEDARNFLLASAEFRAMSQDAALPLIEGRVRRTSGGYGLRFDPELIGQISRRKDRQLDTTRLLAPVKARLLHLSAETLSTEDRARLLAVMGPSRSHAEGLAPGGRIHFNTAHQLLLTLGFLSNRLAVGD